MVDSFGIPILEMRSLFIFKSDVNEICIETIEVAGMQQNEQRVHNFISVILITEFF